MGAAISAKRARQWKDDAPGEFRTHVLAVVSTVLLAAAVCTGVMRIIAAQVLLGSTRIQLPIAKAAAEGEREQLIVAVHAGDRFEVGGEMMEQLESAVAAIQERLAARPGLRVLLRADKDVSMEQMRRLLRALGNGGARNITFSVVDGATRRER